MCVCVCVVPIPWGQVVVAMGWEGNSWAQRCAVVPGLAGGCWRCLLITALASPDPAPQSLLYKKVNEAQYRSHLANEMMMYHMKVRYHEDRDRDGDPRCQHGAPTLYPKVVTQLGGGDTPGFSVLPVVPVAFGTPGDLASEWVTGCGSCRCLMMSTPNC